MDKKETKDLEKVEQLVEKAGCTYAEAKAALEGNEWNLLDAIIALEAEGKARSSSAAYAYAKAPEEEKSGSYVEPEVIHAEDAAHLRPESYKKQARGYGKGDFAEDARHYSRQASNQAKGFFARAKEALTQNYLIVFGRRGTQLLHLPLWALLLIMLCLFWYVLIASLIMMFFGCRFHFEGRDFGRINVNEPFDRAQQKVYETGQRVKNEFSGNVGAEPENEPRAEE